MGGVLCQPRSGQSIQGSAKGHVMYVNRVQFTLIICYDMGHITFRYFFPVGVVIGLLSPHTSRKWVNSMHEATILRSD